MALLYETVAALEDKIILSYTKCYIMSITGFHTYQSPLEGLPSFAQCLEYSMLSQSLRHSCSVFLAISRPQLLKSLNHSTLSYIRTAAEC